MLSPTHTPLVRLSNLFADCTVFAKCEFLAPSGCFKIHGAVHLLQRLTQETRTRQLVVPSMGNTAIGAAVGAKAFGFSMVGVVPKTISPAKDERLRSLGVELMKIDGGGSDLLRRATEVAHERGGYFVHPHLDPLWTDGYQTIARQILEDLPTCRTLVFPVGGGGLLMGVTEFLRERPNAPKLVGCEPHNYPKYARFSHERTRTIADGLILENPHATVQERIALASVAVHLVSDTDIRAAMRELHSTHGLVVEPSSAIAVAIVQALRENWEEPICVILTGENITRDDFHRLIA